MLERRSKSSEPEKSPKKPKSAKKRLIGWGVAVAVLVALVLLLREPDPDPDTFCPESDEILAGEVVVAVDASDAIEASDRDYVIRQIRQRLVDIPPLVRIQTFPVSAETIQDRGGSPEFCSVPEFKWYHHLYRTKGEREEFLEGVENTIRDALQSREADNSPLLERMRTIARPVLGLEMMDSYKELWIVSDMLQHSDKCSFYGSSDCVEPEAIFSHEDYESSFEIPLSGVTVRVFFIARPSEAAENAHRSLRSSAALKDLWQAVFSHMGAKGFEWYD